MSALDIRDVVVRFGGVMALDGPAEERELLEEADEILEQLELAPLAERPIETSEGDGYPIEAMQIMRFNGERWVLQGDVVEAERGP